MPVDRIVAKIGFTADKPASERWPAKITYLVERFVPKDAFRLFFPKLIGLGERSATKRESFFRDAHWGGAANNEYQMTNDKSTKQCSLILLAQGATACERGLVNAYRQIPGRNLSPPLSLNTVHQRFP